ncbi:MAG: bifunctional alpha/beta hydrolase/OsmC family protein [Deferrisomatales bacterium]
MIRRTVTFEGGRGPRLSGRLERPASEPVAYALFAHCFTCTKDLKGAAWLSWALVAKGMGVLRFDFTGLGESEGAFSQTTFSSNVDDLLAAAAYLRREHRAPALLVGHSLGGAAVLAAAGRIPEARAVATIGAPSDTRHLRRTLLEQVPGIVEQGEAELVLGGRRVRLGRQLLEDLEEDHVQRRLATLGRALLVLHSPADEVVDIDHARRIYQGARHPKSFVSLDTADHLLTRERDARYAAEVLAAWASRYLPEAPSPQADAGPPGTVRVRGGPAGLAQTVEAGRHRLAADEPATVPGGADTGPTPYDYLLAALGACTAMTLRLYADRKGWALEGVEAVLRHRKIHAEDCAACETRSGRLDEIERELHLAGPLTGDQRAQLLAIADRCPVHRTLTSEVRILTRLRPGGDDDETS